MDDGDAAVCCADAGVAWRCTSCDKRSEGFAFPYGRCPACDGVLELLTHDATSLVDDAGLAALRTAFEIELGGVGFYTEAATVTTDPVLHDLFGRLAEMEREHLATLTRRYHVAADELGDAVTGHALHRASRHLGHHDVPDDPEGLLRVAIELEERARYLFVQSAPTDDEHPAAARLYRELAAEEGEHIALLSTELTAWLDGRPGLL